MSLSFAEQEVRKSRRISWLAFLGVSGFFSVAFTLIPMPGQELAETRIERLMFTSVELPSVEEIEIEAEPIEEEEDPLEIIEEITEALESEPQENEMLEEDVEALVADAFESLSFSDISLNDAVAQLANREIVSLSDQDVDMDLFAESSSDRPVFNSDMDLTQNLLNDSGNPTRASRSLSSNLIGQSFASTDDADRSRRYVGDLEGLAWPDASGRQTIRATATGASLESSGSESRQGSLFLGEGDISIPSDSLLQWILANQAELDPGIRSLFHFAPPAISARSQNTVEATPSELQLMYTPSNGELRIAMIRQGDIYYFVDPGFQQRAQYFQKGVVGRDAMERVDFVESEDFSPTGPDARNFYTLFLAWWQQEKQAM